MMRAYIKGHDFKALVGVHHPFKDKIAIADGHHRFQAFKELGLKTIRMAVSDDIQYYPFIARGFNQFGLKWQLKFRPKWRKLKNKIMGKKDVFND